MKAPAQAMLRLSINPWKQESTDMTILTQDPKHQTDEEWWQSYDDASRYRQASNTPVSAPQRRLDAPQQDNTLTGSAIETTRSEGAMPGRIVLNQDPKERQTSLGKQEAR